MPDVQVRNLNMHK